MRKTNPVPDRCARNNLFVGGDPVCRVHHRSELADREPAGRDQLCAQPAGEGGLCAGRADSHSTSRGVATACDAAAFAQRHANHRPGDCHSDHTAAAHAFSRLSRPRLPTPLPAQAALTGIQHMFQMWNNCGPANLAMALSYWGWKGDQRLPAAFLKPNGRDKNVMPYEMETYVEQQAGLDAVVRVGGDLEMLKALYRGRFPGDRREGLRRGGFRRLDGSLPGGQRV